MKSIKPISLRPQLLSASVEFLGQEEMECLSTQEGLPDLISQLLHYKEEGKSLYPEIYIIDDKDLVGKVLTNSNFCVVGSGEKNKDTMLTALKKCAPLTEKGWAIYILREDEKFEYGVFRSGTSILSMSISEALIEDGSDELKAISIHQIADKIIEVKGIKADTLLVCYNNQREMIDSPINNQLKFIKTLVEKVDTELKEQTTNFLKKIFLDILQTGHGTLACSIKSDRRTLPKRLEDGIELLDRISIPNVISEVLYNNDLQSNFNLECTFSLISGMMQSDGITVFTDAGEIAAYNVFIKYPKKIEKLRTSGGARSRTFLALESMINNGVKSAYIQSQDGKIEYSNGK